MLIFEVSLTKVDPAYTNDWGATDLPDGVYWYEVVPVGKGGRWVSSLTVLR